MDRLIELSISLEVVICRLLILQTRGGAQGRKSADQVLVLIRGVNMVLVRGVNKHWLGA